MSEEQFWAKVDKTDGCWLWTGFCDAAGYGRFGAKAAHRRAWTFVNGPILNGLWVLHRCDNPPCVRPAHLFLGTHADNMADMARKKRSTPNIGETNPRARLSEDDVRTIRRRQKDGEGVNALAREYGMAHSAISNIMTGVTWGSLK